MARAPGRGPLISFAHTLEAPAMLTILSTSPGLRRVAGLAAAPALLLALAACGDDNDAASGSGGDFCEQAEALDQRFDDSEAGEADIQDVVDELRRLDPPAAIEDDWNELLTAFENFDPEDPSSLDDIDTERVDEASQNIDEYMKEECGIE
jgi:hypothetical protein